MRNKYKPLFLAFMIAIAGNPLSAQNEVDAARLSAFTSTGTARSLGMGGAFSAVGADYSSAWLNPAGLALYRRSEFMFTPGLGFIGNEANYSGQTARAKTANFGLKNAGYVYSSAVKSAGSKDSKTGFNSFAFSIGFNQISNYIRNTAISSYNSHNSITQFFADRAAGYSASNLAQDGGYPGSAFTAYLINPDTNGSGTTWLPAVPGGNVTQNIEIVEKGRNNEWNIGLAGNVGDFFYIGGAIGIQQLSYTQELYYQEKDLANVHVNETMDSTAFNNLEMFDYFKTTGSGFNARLGVIFKPVDFLRIGLSAQSPTWLNLKDLYYTELSATFDNDPNTYGIPTDKIGEGSFSYNLTTPFKVTAGAMVIIKKIGFISADVDYTDYSTASFSSDNSPLSGGYVSFTTPNGKIRKYFAPGINLRVGGELRIDMFRLRAGFANFSPILTENGLKTKDLNTNESISVNGNRRIYSGGFGIKLESFYIDLAILREAFEDWRYFYSIADVNQTSPSLINKKTTISTILTIGFTF